MKTLYLLVIVMMSLHIYTYGEALRVNNQFETDPAQKLYSSIQEAHDAATPGDTLMIEGSPLEYENVGIEKRLINYWNRLFSYRNQSDKRQSFD